MTRKIPAPSEIAGHYNRLMHDLGGEYIHQRWGDSEIKRRHYRQTELGIRFGLASVTRLGDVLEIGSGPAVWTSLYLADARSAVLLDISEEMLAQAAKRVEQMDDGRHVSKTSYMCGDFLDVTLPDAGYDTIISSRAFEYMADKLAFVKKCFRLLRPGGSLLVVTKNEDWRDLRATRQNLTSNPGEPIPVGLAMQLDLVSSSGMLAMMSETGFLSARTYPVVLGSYQRPFVWRPTLFILDLLHGRYYRRPLAGTPHILRSLTESFLAIGKKPA